MAHFRINKIFVNLIQFNCILKIQFVSYSSQPLNFNFKFSLEKEIFLSFFLFLFSFFFLFFFFIFIFCRILFLEGKNYICMVCCVYMNAVVSWCGGRRWGWWWWFGMEHTQPMLKLNWATVGEESYYYYL